MVLKGFFTVVLKPQFDIPMVDEFAIIIAFKVGLGSSQETFLWVASLIQCMKYGPERI